MKGINNEKRKRDVREPLDSFLRLFNETSPITNENLFDSTLSNSIKSCLKIQVHQATPENRKNKTSEIFRSSERRRSKIYRTSTPYDRVLNSDQRKKSSDAVQSAAQLFENPSFCSSVQAYDPASSTSLWSIHEEPTSMAVMESSKKNRTSTPANPQRQNDLFRASLTPFFHSKQPNDARSLARSPSLWSINEEPSENIDLDSTDEKMDPDSMDYGTGTEDSRYVTVRENSLTLLGNGDKTGFYLRPTNDIGVQTNFENSSAKTPTMTTFQEVFLYRPW